MEYNDWGTPEEALNDRVMQDMTRVNRDEDTIGLWN